MIKTTDITVDKENPFKNCKLNREQYADILTTVIKSYKEGFVMAINNKWGEGKTTFVKMWKQKLKNDGFETLYFNAWENDFEDNALTAIIGELKSLSDKGNKAKEDFKELLKAGAILGKNILPGLAKALVGKYINVEELQSFVEAATKGMTEIFEEDVKEYTNKKESIKDFKKKLEKFVKDATHDKPLIFIIDELDRCRPNYAVSVLEKVKHFFSVPGIVFILSIDKEQLGNAVKGVYGNDNIDAEEYLRRFIDLEYSLPEPNIDEYCNYLYDYYNFNSFFKSEIRENRVPYYETEHYFLKTMKVLLNSHSPTLRQQQKIFTHAKLAIRMFKINEHLIPSIFAFLIYLKFYKIEIYNRIKNRKISIEEIQNEFYNSTSYLKKGMSLYNYTLTLEAYIIYFSANHLSENRHSNDLIFMNENGEKESRIKSKYDNDSTFLINVFKELDYASHYFGFDHQINKIELAENFKTHS
ncbi:P-loop NTPase fold protein [Flavobacterium rakeshii]|uniref:KAP family P-loop NTPase fold protein n=1 Tax=Flavobacterium rakeshii TaxID=1038845 RepID=UPI002E7BE0B6|nr:P-loop NTPase fold protein [Flavobacterium rakeshii]MEE1900032.1 P-loop NTPase fold protein [Flavobacterium rakeshii]